MKKAFGAVIMISCILSNLQLSGAAAGSIYSETDRPEKLYQEVLAAISNGNRTIVAALLPRVPRTYGGMAFLKRAMCFATHENRPDIEGDIRKLLSSRERRASLCANGKRQLPPIFDQRLSIQSFFGEPAKQEEKKPSNPDMKGVAARLLLKETYVSPYLTRMLVQSRTWRPKNTEEKK